MCADQLKVALIIPNIDAFSGGMERTLKLVEYSASAGIQYTCLEPAGGAPNAEVANRLLEFERSGLVERRRLDRRVLQANGTAYDAVAIPTEYWWGPWRRAKEVGLVGPYCLDFHQLPYIGTLDILKREGIDDPALPDLVRLPFLQARVYTDGFFSSAVSTAAGVASVRSLLRLRNGRVLATTPVVAKNLSCLGYRGPVSIPECPNGIARAPVEESLRTEEPFEFDGVYVGRFHPQKGFLDLPYIVAQMKKTLGSDVRIAVCGGADTASYTTRFKGLVESLGVQENVSILRRIPKADLYRTLRRSRMLLYPSYVDGFSLTVLESLCLGVPVVAYDIDAMRMIWRRRRGVFSVPVGNPRALAQVACEIRTDFRLADARKEAGAQSGALLEEYRWERVVLGERRFYEGVCEGLKAAN